MQRVKFFGLLNGVGGNAFRRSYARRCALRRRATLLHRHDTSHRQRAPSERKGLRDKIAARLREKIQRHILV
jgi:hypothetical protein